MKSSTSSEGFLVYITPEEGSETTLIVPLVMNNKTGEIAPVMRVNPRFSEGYASLEIVNTTWGPGLKITTDQYLHIWYNKDYDNISSENLIKSRTLSMTEITYDENGYEMNRGIWVYANSTTNQTSRILISMRAGNETSHHLRVSGRNVSNGWHKFNIEEGFAVA